MHQETKIHNMQEIVCLNVHPDSYHRRINADPEESQRAVLILLKEYSDER